MKKRVLSLILTIILSLMNIGVFSADTADMNGEYERVRNILEAIGAFERYTAIADLEGNLSRADFISLCIAVAFPDNSGGNTDVSPFADVNTSMASYKYISTAQKMGIISGNGNGKFRPAEPVTYDEALKILISILGYDLVAEEKGGYPGGYRAVANNLDLNDGLSDKVSAEFKYGDSLILLLNALNTEVYEIDSISTDNGVTLRKGETLLYNSFRIVKDEGVLTENGYTTLTAPKTSMDGSITIGDFSGKIYGGVEAENYIGYDVEFYYQEDAECDYIVYMEPTSANRVTYISSEYEVKTSGSTISYCPNDEGKRKSVTIPSSGRVIYNGKAYPEYTMDIFEKKDADFRLIDNNNDGTVDVINAAVWNNVFVHAVDIEEKRIIDKYDGSAMIELKDADDYIIWDKNFNQLLLSDVKTGVVATSIRSIDGNYVRVIITEDCASGTVTEKKNKNGNTVLSLDGIEYVVSNSYEKKISVLPNLGSSATFCFDYTGRIAGIESKNSGFEYGYIIAASDSGAVFGDYISIKILCSNNTIKAFDTDEKLKVDGDTYNDNMYDNLSQPQIIRYKLTEDNKIKEIDTATGTPESENSLRALTPKGTMHYFPTSKVFGGTYDDDGTFDDDAEIHYCMLVPDTDTLIYIVPDPSSGMGDDSDYMVTTLDYMAGTSITKKVFQGFNADADSCTPDVVYMQNDGSGNLSRGKNPALVTGVFETLNKDGMHATQLDVVNNKGETRNLIFTTELEQSNVVSVNVGDFINYTFDMYNEVSDIKVVCTKDGICDDKNYITGYFGQDFNPYYGTALDRQGSTIVMENTAYAGKEYYLPVGNAPIYVVEKIRNDYTVNKGTVDDIYDSKHFGNEAASKVFYYTFQTVPRMIVVYR